MQQIPYANLCRERERCPWPKPMFVQIGWAEGMKYTGKYGYPILNDMSAEDALNIDFAAVVCPGGFAPDFFRRSQPMKETDLHRASQSTKDRSRDMYRHAQSLRSKPTHNVHIYIYMYAPGLVRGRPGGPFDELIRGPLIQKKHLVPQNGAFQELIRGPGKS